MQKGRANGMMIVNPRGRSLMGLSGVQGEMQSKNQRHARTDEVEFAFDDLQLDGMKLLLLDTLRKEGGKFRCAWMDEFRNRGHTTLDGSIPSGFVILVVQSNRRRRS